MHFPRRDGLYILHSSCTQIIRPDPASEISLVTQGKSLHKVPHTHKNRHGLEETCMISLPHSSSCEDIFAHISAVTVHVSFWHLAWDFKQQFLKCFDLNDGDDSLNRVLESRVFRYNVVTNKSRLTFKVLGRWCSIMVHVFFSVLAIQTQKILS